MTYTNVPDLHHLIDEFFSTGRIPTAASLKPATTFPKYSIYKNGDKVYLEFAVAGFRENDLSVELENDILKVSGKAKKEPDPNALTSDDPVYIYKGIAERDFTLNFRINPRLEIEGASLEYGILKVVLTDTGYRTRKIEIKTPESSKDTRQFLSE